jgi:hypothetical protein
VQVFWQDAEAPSPVIIAQQSWPAQLAPLVHATVAPWHCPDGTHVSVTPVPPGCAQHS